METTQVQLPPSGRDFEVYRLVKVEQKSTREAAELCGISQTRVCQVIERVAGFLVEVAPAAEDDERNQQQLHVARQVAAERVDFLYGKAVRSFDSSQAILETVREVETGLKPKAKISTLKKSFGDSRFLLAAARLVMLAAKLPVSMLGLGNEGCATEDEEEEIESDATNPPEGDCSPPVTEQAVMATESLPKDAATLTQESKYINAVLANLHSKKDIAAPVQTANPPNPTGAHRRALTPSERRKSFLTQGSP